jgi:uncharacterized protein (TIGR02757 family)
MHTSSLDIEWSRVCADPGDHDLKPVLDALYTRYNRKKYIQYDPIKYVHCFRDETEIELVALMVSCLSFGRVTQIFKAVDRLLHIMGNDPLHYVLTLGKTPGNDLISFQYRFITGLDVYHLLSSARKMIVDYGSVGRFAAAHYEEGSVTGLVEKIIAAFQGVHYLMPGSLKTSACKRLFMFLRWMVRSDHVDLGVWDFIRPRDLVIPLDTHIGRVSRMLGLTSGKSPSLKTAMEITDSLKRYSKNDPVRYDWALSHIGIIKNNFPDEHCLTNGPATTDN